MYLGQFYWYSFLNYINKLPIYPPRQTLEVKGFFLNGHKWTP